MSAGMFGLLELVGAWLSKPFAQPAVAACYTDTAALAATYTITDAAASSYTDSDALAATYTASDARC